MKSQRCVCHITLLNSDVLLLEISIKQTVDSLLTQVNDRLALPEDSRIFFALYFLDADRQIQWLNPVDRIVNVAMPRSAEPGEVHVYHGVRYFPECCLSIPDPGTVVMFFFDALVQFVKGYLLLDLDNFCMCCAVIVLQNCQLPITELADVVRLFEEGVPCPNTLLRQFEASAPEIHDLMFEKVKRLAHCTKSELIARFLQICEASVSFGNVFYKVKDNTGHDMRLAINSRSMMLFEAGNLYQPKKVFLFSQVDDILCADDLLVLTVRCGKNETFDQSLSSNSLRKFQFRCGSATRCKQVWSAAVSQHKFYRSRPSEVTRENQEYTLKRVTDILSRLFENSSSSLVSIKSASSVSSLTSSTSKPMLGVSSTKFRSTERTKQEKEHDLEVYYKLKADIKLIEEELRRKLVNLKDICVEEATLTGFMPKEIYMTLQPGESVPVVSKRVGTAFKFDRELLKTSEHDRLEQLQADVHLHRKIVAAAEKLAKEKTANKSVRKKRRRDLEAAALRLRGLEKGLYRLRVSISKPDVSDFEPLQHAQRSRAGSGFSLNSLRSWPQLVGNFSSLVAKSCPATPRGSVPDLSVEEAERLSVGKAVALRRGPAERTAHKISLQNWHQDQRRASSQLPSGVPQRNPTTSSLGSNFGRVSRQSSTISSFDAPAYTNIGYKSVTPYRSSYRQSNFPTFHDLQTPTRSRSHVAFKNNGVSDSPRNHGPNTSHAADWTRVSALSTSSLDRRMLRTKEVTPQFVCDSTSSGVSSASSSSALQPTSTTFPVSNCKTLKRSSDAGPNLTNKSRLEAETSDSFLSLISAGIRGPVNNRHLISSASQGPNGTTIV